MCSLLIFFLSSIFLLFNFSNCTNEWIQKNIQQRLEQQRRQAQQNLNNNQQFYQQISQTSGSVNQINDQNPEILNHQKIQNYLEKQQKYPITDLNEHNQITFENNKKIEFLKVKKELGESQDTLLPLLKNNKNLNFPQNQQIGHQFLKVVKEEPGNTQFLQQIPQQIQKQPKIIIHLDDSSDEESEDNKLKNKANKSGQTFFNSEKEINQGLNYKNKGKQNFENLEKSSLENCSSPFMENKRQKINEDSYLPIQDYNKCMDFLKQSNIQKMPERQNFKENSQNKINQLLHQYEQNFIRELSERHGNVSHSDKNVQKSLNLLKNEEHRIINEIANTKMLQHQNNNYINELIQLQRQINPVHGTNAYNPQIKHLYHHKNVQHLLDFSINQLQNQQHSVLSQGNPNNHSNIKFENQINTKPENEITLNNSSSSQQHQNKGDNYVNHRFEFPPRLGIEENNENNKVNQQLSSDFLKKSE